MNKDICINDLQAVIYIFNLQILDECNCVETRTYPCGDRNVPVSTRNNWFNSIATGH